MGRRALALVEDDQPDTKFTVNAMVGIGQLFEGDPAGGLPLIAEAVKLAQEFDDPRRLVHAGACAGYMGDDEAELRLYSRAVKGAREIAAVGTLPYVLEYLAKAEAVGGRYARATAHASEGLRLAQETGQLNSVCTLLATLALIAAGQGREDDCRDCAARTLEASTSRGLGYQSALARWALARLSLGYGRSADALEHLETIAAAVPGAGHPFIRLLATADLVEAAVRCRRVRTPGRTPGRLYPRGGSRRPGSRDLPGAPRLATERPGGAAVRIAASRGLRIRPEVGTLRCRAGGEAARETPSASAARPRPDVLR
jgi:hypothetical protein